MRKTLAVALALAVTTATGTAFAADGSVTGHFRAEGKDGTLSFVRAAKGKRPYSDDPAVYLAFTEKDASGAKDLKDDTIVFSHKYGTAITLDIFKNSDGKYEVDDSAFHHSGSEKAGGSASGLLQIKDVSEAGGMISGEVYTNPGADLFGAKVEIDLKFKAPLPK